jgi:HEAT repeat protein
MRKMKSLVNGKRARLLAFALAFGLVAAAVPAATKPESELLRDLNSANETTVCDALLGLEKGYPSSVEARTKIVALLSDPRIRVHRKAARVLGAIGAKVDDDGIARVTALLSAHDTETIIDGLKALRGMGNARAVPAILPLLASPDANVKRDSCRTLAVLADKTAIPAIEPLLSDKNPKVQEDARQAIAKLREK